MRPSWNVSVQVVAVVVAAAARLAHPGYVLAVAFFLCPVVTIGLVVQVGTALRARALDRLPGRIAWPSTLAAVGAVGAGLLISDLDDEGPGARPFDVLFGTQLAEWAESVGYLMAVAWAWGLVAAVVAVRAARPRPAGVPVG